MQEDSKRSLSDAEPRSCGKCGGTFDPLTWLPGLGDRPAYRIVRCAACGFVEWIAEKIAP